MGLTFSIPDLQIQQVFTNQTVFFFQAVVDRNFKHIHIILSLAIPGSIFLICLIIVTTMCVIKCRGKEAPLPKQQVSRKYLDPSMLTNTNQPVQVKDRPLPGSYSDLVDARQKQLPPPLTSNTTV